MDINERNQIIADLKAAAQSMKTASEAQTKRKDLEDRMKNAGKEASKARMPEPLTKDQKDSIFRDCMNNIKLCSMGEVDRRFGPERPSLAGTIVCVAFGCVFAMPAFSVLMLLLLGSTEEANAELIAVPFVLGALSITLLLSGIIPWLKYSIKYKAYKKHRQKYIEQVCKEAEEDAKKKALATIAERENKYRQARREYDRILQQNEDAKKAYQTSDDALKNRVSEGNARAKALLDKYHIPDAFRNRGNVGTIAELFEQQVVSTFQEAYGRLREEQEANTRFRIDQMNRQFQWEMERDAQRERDRRLEEERRWQRDVDRMHREKLEAAARDLAYEERRKADALEDIKKKLED